MLPPIFGEKSCNCLKIMEMDSCVCEFFCCSFSHICRIYTQLIQSPHFITQTCAMGMLTYVISLRVFYAYIDHMST